MRVVQNREMCETLKKYNFRVGDEILFTTWKLLKASALMLSSIGYGVAVIGFTNMSNNVLTITALPEGAEEET